MLNGVNKANIPGRTKRPVIVFKLDMKLPYVYIVEVGPEVGYCRAWRGRQWVIKLNNRKTLGILFPRGSQVKAGLPKWNFFSSEKQKIIGHVKFILFVNIRICILDIWVQPHSMMTLQIKHTQQKWELKCRIIWHTRGIQ